MKSTPVSAFLIFGAIPVLCQQGPPQPVTQSGPVPIYHVTVTERTVKAINYQYRSGPTMIDFRGTVLMPKAKGEAIVESKQGRSEIDVRFDSLIEPSRFGREYLTYVLWALTPDGRPHNIGEVVANGSDKAHLRVTTDYQAFAMIVTAEPYSAVRLPSDVVVLENQVRPDTIGKIEQVEARYELMPRGQYSWQVPDKSQTPNGPKVSMRKYEELSELYQAQNALAIAHNAKAEQYAPNTFAKADQLLTEAQQMERSKGDSSRVIQAAREASQTAEDARQIAERHQQDEKLAKAQAEVAAAKQAQATAEAEVQRMKSEAEAAKSAADAEKAARERAEADAAAARVRQQPEPQSQLLPPPPPPRQTMPQASPQNAQQTAERMRMLEKLNGPLATRDTPRGLISVVPNGSFNGVSLNPTASGQIARAAAIIAATPGLRIEVEGHTETADSDSLSSRRAAAVREILISRGLSPSSVTARGLGNSRPIVSNAAANGREENQRVEIIVMGNPIGTVPSWDRTYALR